MSTKYHSYRHVTLYLCLHAPKKLEQTIILATRQFGGNVGVCSTGLTPPNSNSSHARNKNLWQLIIECFLK
ncbi:hypothetical protein L596_006594 [Steinernema carpocapsae]|uniref:Uncharacterized protein n=1 Tax=Steinernema carpocapsae TaxID=34508 RepID=A0A4V6I951_STECR|nr:hypothetical protein L596_006594 [Steinernema carpocapsae]